VQLVALSKVADSVKCWKYRYYQGISVWLCIRLICCSAHMGNNWRFCGFRKLENKY
jgi:hypothetical protein